MTPVAARILLPDPPHQRSRATTACFWTEHPFARLNTYAKRSNDSPLVGHHQSSGCAISVAEMALPAQDDAVCREHAGRLKMPCLNVYKITPVGRGVTSLISIAAYAYRPAQSKAFY